MSQRDFAIYWSSNGVTRSAAGCTGIAVAWLAWELTKSTVWLGIVAFAESIPLVIFSVVAGAMADRVGYIRITILAQTATAVAAVVFAAMTLLDLMTIELVVVFALLTDPGSLTTPARMALVHALVPRDNLAAAIGLTGATFNGSRFVGPAVAGVLIIRVRRRAGGCRRDVYAVLFRAAGDPGGRTRATPVLGRKYLAT